MKELTLVILALLLSVSVACGGESDGDGDGDADGDADGDDCTVEGCEGFTWCDESTGRCEPGCDRAEQCSDDERCDVAAHECVCVDGMHRCDGGCVSDDDVATCGDRCEPCPEIDDGDAICDDGECGVDCFDGFLECGGGCALCPTEHVETVTCGGDACVPASCVDGWEVCGDRCCWDGGAGWDDEIVTRHSDSFHYSHTWISLALDDEDRPRISYVDTETHEVRFSAWDAATGWSDESVHVETPAASVYADLALDPDDVPVIGICAYSRAVRLARWDGSSWVVEDVVEADCRGMSLAIDAGAEHLLWYDRDEGIRLATRSGASWTLETVASRGLSSGARPSLALDDSGSEHVAFYDPTLEEFRYATRGSAGWSVESIVGAEHSSISRNYIAIAVGSDDVPQVVMHAGVDTDLSYGVRGSSGWSVTLIDTLGGAHGLSIEVGVGSTPHLAWAHGWLHDESVMHGWDDGSGFSSVAPAGEGDWPDIAIDSVNAPHIAYSDDVTGGVTYVWSL